MGVVTDGLVGHLYSVGDNGVFDMPNFSVLLTECQQLENRRQRVKKIAPQIWLSILRDVTAQILDVDWEDYTKATSL